VGWSLDLRLEALKPVVAHRLGGLSPKSEAPGNASYYLSSTRLRTVGEVTLDGEPVSVSGQSGFDHEWSTSALGPQAVGWDGFSLQLADERELMLFQIRNALGSLDPVSGGTLIEADGRGRALRRDQMELKVETWWRSPSTGARYPARWHVSMPEDSIELSVEPLLADQEMQVSFPYWEGAVRVSGTSRGVPI
jgi:predicted secreted hydrolase